MIYLREIKEEDAILMLEWMHDKSIQKAFRKDMSRLTYEDAVGFCKEATIPHEIYGGEDIHWAIADDNDEYLGTISLKNLDVLNKTAEYAICLRRKAHGKGIAQIATQKVLREAFYTYGLNRVYLNVLESNVKAISLYQRSGFLYEGTSREHLFIDNKFVNLQWYGILKKDFENRE